MTSTGSVDRMTPSRHLLIIVARVIAATKCKLGANCCRWSVRPPPTPSRRAARVIQRIFKMFQGNCVVCVVPATGGGDETPGRCERTPVCGNLRRPARRRNADLLCAPASCLERRFRRPDVRRYSSRVGGPIQTGAGSVGGLAGVASPPYCAARRRNAYAASSMAKIAVSGWLIGSTPTRLTIEVIVPSASASTQAARCSSPK